MPNKSEKKTAKEKIFLAFILSLALVLRLINLKQSFWLDEAINVQAAGDLSLPDLLFEYSLGDFHPPLFHLVLWIIFQITEISELTARLPSVIFSLLTIYLVYKITKQVIPNNKSILSPALMSAAFLSTSGLHIYYSQEARMYSLAALLATSTLLSVVNLGKSKTLTNNLFYLFSLVFMLSSDYQPWLLLPLLFFVNPGLTALGTLITFPIWPLIINQFKIGLLTADVFPAWETVVGRITTKSILLVPVKFLVGRVSIDNNLVFASLILIPLTVASFAILKAWSQKKSEIKFLFAWLFLPLFLAAIVSFWVPIFSYFRFLYLLPAFYILISIGMSRLSKIAFGFSLLVLLITNIFTSGAYLINRKFHRENWKGLANHLAGYKHEDLLVVIPNQAQAAPLEYYGQEYLKIQDKNSLDLSHKPRNVFYIRYVADIFDPQDEIISKLEKKHYQKADVQIFNGIVVWMYRQKD